MMSFFLWRLCGNKKIGGISMNTVPKIMIKPDGLAAIGSYATSLWTKRKVVLISDQNNFNTYGTKILQYLSIFGFDVQTLLLNESLYTTNTASFVYEFLTRQKFSSSDGVIGLGDDALCQLSGYISATYLGGLSLIQIPTTLSAQLTVCTQRKACLINLEAKSLQSVVTKTDGIMIDTSLNENLSDDELSECQALLLRLGISQDHECRHELRRMARIVGHQLNQDDLFNSIALSNQSISWIKLGDSSNTIKKNHRTALSLKVKKNY